jgi:hypothetical protein
LRSVFLLVNGLLQQSFMKEPDSIAPARTASGEAQALAAKAKAAAEQAQEAKLLARLAKRRFKQARRDFKQARKAAKKARKAAKELQAAALAAARKSANLKRRKSAAGKLAASPKPMPTKKQSGPDVPPLSEQIDSKAEAKPKAKPRRKKRTAKPVAPLPEKQAMMPAIPEGNRDSDITDEPAPVPPPQADELK